MKTLRPRIECADALRVGFCDLRMHHGVPIFIRHWLGPETLDVCVRSHELERQMQLSKYDAILVFFDAATQQQLIELARRSYGRGNNPPIIGTFEIRDMPALKVMPLAAAGVTELLAEHIVSRKTIAEAVSASSWARIVAATRRGLETFLSDRLMKVWECVASTKTHRPTVKQVASRLSVSESTLRNWCTAEKQVQPEQLISWFRLLLASSLIALTRTTVKDTALSLGFPSTAALRMLIVRHTAMRVHDFESASPHNVIAAFRNAASRQANKKRSTDASEGRMNEDHSADIGMDT